MASLATLRTDTYNILNQPESTDNTVFSITEIERLLNSEQDRICREYPWQFLKKTFLFDSPVASSLQADLATSDTTATIGSTTGWTTGAGKMYVQGDIIDFTSRSGTTLSGVSGVGIDHTSGQNAFQLLTLPTDYSHQPTLTVENIKHDYIDEDKASQEDLNRYPSRRHWWTIRTEDGSYYIQVSGNAGDKPGVLSYFKEATTMDDNNGSTIPDPFARRVLPLFAAGKAILERGDDMDQQGTRLLQRAEQELMLMKKYYNIQFQTHGRRIPSQYQGRGITLGDTHYTRTIS